MVGDPEGVRNGLRAFVEELQPDELMLTAQIYDHEARLRSFEIAAQAMRAVELPAKVTI